MKHLGRASAARFSWKTFFRRNSHVCALTLIAMTSGIYSSSATAGLGLSERELGMTAFGYFNPVLYGKSAGLAALQFGFRDEQFARAKKNGWAIDVQGVASSYVGASQASGGQGAAASQTSFWFEAPELAWAPPPFENAQITIGRKIENWSSLDEAWGLGIWQARNRWDYLHVSSVGLAGLFTDYKQGAWGFRIFASGLFIPERGPTLSVRDGVFYPSNPWASSPPSSAPLVKGIDADIQYSIVMPSLAKLLLQPSLAAQARYGAEAGKDGEWITASYANKPINQIALAYDGSFDLGTDQANALIYPRVARHQIAQIEAGHQDKRATSWASALFEAPSLASAPSTWTYQTFPNSLLLGAGGSFKLASRIEAFGDYLKRFGPTAADQGPQAAAGSSVFDPRTLFGHAVSGGVRGSVLGSERLTARLKMTYAFESAGTLMSTELRYRPVQSWILALGADVLGADSPSVSRQNDFITKYRAHDRVYGGVSYAY